MARHFPNDEAYIEAFLRARYDEQRMIEALDKYQRASQALLAKLQQEQAESLRLTETTDELLNKYMNTINSAFTSTSSSSSSGSESNGLFITNPYFWIALAALFLLVLTVEMCLAGYKWIQQARQKAQKRRERAERARQEQAKMEQEELRTRLHVATLPWIDTTELHAPCALCRKHTQPMRILACRCADAFVHTDCWMSWVRFNKPQEVCSACGYVWYETRQRSF